MSPEPGGSGAQAKQDDRSVRCDSVVFILIWRCRYPWSAQMKTDSQANDHLVAAPFSYDECVELTLNDVRPGT